MQERAREHDSAAYRRLESPLVPVLGKDDLATIEIGVEVDRDREPAVCRPSRGVVAMRPEVPAILGGIARNDMALDERRLELVHLADLWHDATLDETLRPIDDLGVDDVVVAAPLVIVAVDDDRLAVDLLHEARFGAAMLLVQRDEGLAELGLEDVGQHQDRRRHLEPGK